MQSYYQEDLRIARLIAEASMPRVVYDVGASDGGWSRAVSEVFPEARFEMFEPLHGHMPDYAPRMAEALAECPLLRLHPLAVGSQNGEVEFQMTPDGVSSTSLAWEASATLAHTIRVPMRTIDSLVHDDGLPSPDMIKMDVQGGELEALRGAAASLDSVRFLFLETWLMRGYGSQTPLLHELTIHLARYGFQIFDVGDIFRSEGGRGYAIDVCFWKP